MKYFYFSILLRRKCVQMAIVEMERDNALKLTRYNAY